MSNVIRIASEPYVDEKFNELSGQITTQSVKINDGGKKSFKTMVSFIDDDCKTETYSVLFNDLLKTDESISFPYTLACPPGNIGDNGYMTETQLKEMYNHGVSICGHHWRQYNMDDEILLPTEDSYDEDLRKCKDKFQEWGFEDVSAVSYPQGKYKYDYMFTVKKHYKMGFTVDRGINQIPYESYYMKRVELFSNSSAVDTVEIEVTYTDNSGSSITESVIVPTIAKNYVDTLESEDGWLVFMTHAWYQYFNITQLDGLVKYIKSKGIDIVDVNSAIEKTGNIIDIGYFKKPLEERSMPFFVIDSTGEVWTNSLSIIEKAEFEYDNLVVSYYTGSYVNPSGSFRTGHSDSNRTVSVQIPVTAGEVYLLTCSAIYEQALYVIGTPIEGSNSITAFDIEQYPNAYIIPQTNTAEGIVGDTILIDYEVTIPADGVMYVSSNRNIQPDGFVIKKRR